MKVETTEIDNVLKEPDETGPDHKLCEKTEQIMELLEKSWEKRQIKEKFVEFEEIIQTRSKSRVSKNFLLAFSRIFWNF